MRNTPFLSRPWAQAAGACLAVTAAFMAADKFSAPTTHQAPQPAAQQPKPELPQDTKDALAHAINANGYLCAKVDYWDRINADEIRVGCIEYRDGTGAKSYVVNMKTGRAADK